jgi:hypothetical protein
MKTTTAVSVTTLVAFLFIGVITLGMWGCPKYDVYSKKM